MPTHDDPTHDKLYKVRFLTDHLGKRFADEFTSHQQVAIDECLKRESLAERRGRESSLPV